jgi:hypothetical protein
MIKKCANQRTRGIFIRIDRKRKLGPPPTKKKKTPQRRKNNRNKERNVSIVIFQHHQVMELTFQNSCWSFCPVQQFS